MTNLGITTAYAMSKTGCAMEKSPDIGPLFFLAVVILGTCALVIFGSNEE